MALDNALDFVLKLLDIHMIDKDISSLHVMPSYEYLDEIYMFPDIHMSHMDIFCLHVLLDDV
jgi:hypothetical protein